VLLFAFSTQLAWSYYGAKATAYLTNESRHRGHDLQGGVPAVRRHRRGVLAGRDHRLLDAMIFAMSVPNLIGVYLLVRVVRRELTDYEADRRSGVISKVEA
jgi:AGCS family alanine or glycine:cation symporter